ncbi:hypothetical protein ACS0TY_015983 [Phlomoides rotata]
MILLSWNCGGLGNPATIPALCELVRARRPSLVFLSETLCAASKIEEIRVKLKFDSCFNVNVVGRSRGLCIIWNPSTLCNVLSYSNNHIDVLVTELNKTWRFTGFYGYPNRNNRLQSWNLLRSLSSASPLPWLCMGDYNDLLGPEDKRGRVEHPNWLFQGFRNAVSDCNLVDLPLVGYQFTWCRSKGTRNAVEERLDRAMVTPSWSDIFPNAQLINLVAPVSDHNPIMVNTEPGNVIR